MQYLYHANAASSVLRLEGDKHRYIFKVRRHRTGETIYLRNLKDDYLYKYIINSIDKKQAELDLLDSKELVIMPKRQLHIGWCMIDPKSIEKMLPTLNETGITKITFIYCDRSQKQFSLDMKRLDKILLNSSQQCGRSRLIEIEIADTLSDFVTLYPESVLLNFSENKLDCHSGIETIIVGCEGGLSEAELALFEESDIVGLETPLILKSESAVSAVASKLLL